MSNLSKSMFLAARNYDLYVGGRLQDRLFFTHPIYKYLILISCSGIFLLIIVDDDAAHRYIGSFLNLRFPQVDFDFCQAQRLDPNFLKFKSKSQNFSVEL